jgi:hypothetical protein
MGFRSVFVSEDRPCKLPGWFCEKWSRSIHWYEHEGSAQLPISSRYERKFYDGVKEELFGDLRRIVADPQCWPYGTNEDPLEVLLFHECGGVTKVYVFADEVVLAEPEPQIEWDIKAEVGHHYDYGCSDPGAIRDKKERLLRDRIAQARSLSGT